MATGDRELESGATHVEPDRVNAVVEGYFRIPAVWIGSAPSNPAAETGMSLGGQIALRATLSCGIEAYAMRNGLFLFDFLKSNIAQVLRVPGFERPPTPPYTPPRAHALAGAEAEKVSLLARKL